MIKHTKLWQNCSTVRKIEDKCMIVREQGAQLFLITQPHHAAITCHFAGHWRVTAFLGFDMLEAVLFTISEHDHCWRKADAAPLFDPAAGRPWSFDDYPEEEKIGLYRNGLDTMEKANPYAAWLCSRHFGSFFKLARTDSGRKYFLHENVRQDRLRDQLSKKGVDLKAGDFHFHLLQFCDNLSLFVCLNQAGLNQHPWFLDGFAGSDQLRIGPGVLNATWENPETLMIRPFPFDDEFTIDLEYRVLPSGLSSQKELDQRWETAPVQIQTIRII